MIDINKITHAISRAFANGSIDLSGLKGEKGDKGDKGERGEQGLQGAKGDTVIIGDEQTYTLYSVGGENTDGAMTQKAVTNAIGVMMTQVEYDATTIESNVKYIITEDL